MIDESEQTRPLNSNVSDIRDSTALEKYLPLGDTIQIINRMGPYGHVTLHLASCSAYHEVVQVIFTNPALKSFEHMSYQFASEDQWKMTAIKELFLQNSNLFHSYEELQSDDYIDWSLIGRNLIQKRREFREQIDLYKTYDNQHHLITKLLIEIIEYYLNEYLIEQEHFSKDEANRIEFFFRQAIEEQSYLKYFIKAYTLTNSFYRVLNKHLALYILDYFDPSSYSSSPKKYRLINCLVHIVTLLINHPDIHQYEYQGVTYRGLLMTANGLKQYHIGNHILNRSFVSTSKTRAIAQMFAGNNQLTTDEHGETQISVLLKYTIRQSQTAIDIEHLSTLQEEEEVLILPFSVFQIKNRMENNSDMSPLVLVEIDLEECLDDEQIDQHQEKNKPPINSQYRTTKRQKATRSRCFYSIVGLLIIGSMALTVGFIIKSNTQSHRASKDDSLDDVNEPQSQCPNIANRIVWHARPYVTRVNLTTLPVEYIVIRHVSSLTTIMNQQDCIKAIKYVQDYHMDKRGWLDIGYNFLLCDNNHNQQKIYRGRGWTYGGAHCIGYNHRSLGIGTIGDYTSVNSLNAFKALIQCGIRKKIIVSNFTLFGDVNSTDIYKYYLAHFRNDTDLQYSNQDSNKRFFCD